jgi:murein DD-endopeptidase MepM/ murein hydrolase activator NlpD
VKSFIALPADGPLHVAWPTPNQFLLAAPEKFFARTRVNPDYGKPGWTRDCGKRFHCGCDIAPVDMTPTGETTTVVFTDGTTGQDFASEEPTFVPNDDVFCVSDGVVVEAVTDETASDFGRHVVVEHRWPVSGEKFYTLYGHLSEIHVANHQSLITGHLLGKMGQTSRVADARNWMLVAPHLHFEVRNAAGAAYDPVEFLKSFGR